MDIHEQKEVSEKALIYCDYLEGCCGAHRECLATYHILQTGNRVFKHCGCDDPVLA